MSRAAMRKKGEDLRDSSSEPVDERVRQTPEVLEKIARRAYEISLSPQGGSSEANWRRAEEEVANSPCAS
jgi:hypothetical protein